MNGGIHLKYRFVIYTCLHNAIMKYDPNILYGKT